MGEVQGRLAGQRVAEPLAETAGGGRGDILPISAVLDSVDASMRAVRARNAHLGSELKHALARLDAFEALVEAARRDGEESAAQAANWRAKHYASLEVINALEIAQQQSVIRSEQAQNFFAENQRLVLRLDALQAELEIARHLKVQSESLISYWRSEHESAVNTACALEVLTQQLTVRAEHLQSALLAEQQRTISIEALQAEVEDNRREFAQASGELALWREKFETAMGAVADLQRAKLESEARAELLSVTLASQHQQVLELGLLARGDTQSEPKALLLEHALTLAQQRIDSFEAALSASVHRAGELEAKLDEHRQTLREVFDQRGRLSGQLDWLERLYARDARPVRLWNRLWSTAQGLPGLGLCAILPQALRISNWDVKRSLRLLKHIRTIRAGGLFDHDFYLSANWDVRLSGANPLVHYVTQGWRDGRDPSPSFSTRHYLATYPDVLVADICPLLHYQLHGRAQGRQPQPFAMLRASNEANQIARCSASTVSNQPHVIDGPATGGTPRDPYSIRPDDVVSDESATGQAFLERFGLLGPLPDWAGAVASLNAAPLTIQLAGPGVVPDATIIVPVYKQLAYSLNCIDALLRHKSRFVAEIIIMDDNSPDESRVFLPQVQSVRVERNPENLGYLRNCNRGAKLARGRFIVHLNNDTRVVEGWLDELIGHFEVHPNTGLVGSKLLYPTGALQEAGGIIWQDGSAWNYGRNDDSNRPEYCYARSVDYCSAASVAIPRQLWDELGGFDELYVPAYCEDSDLAFRVRHQAGKEVWYQPLSRVIHYEGISSGRDLTQGPKSYQVANSKKFFDRWAEVLRHHRQNAVEPMFERDRSVNKRALVIEPTTPTPDQDAGSNTVVNTCRVLQLLGYKVTFIPEDNMLYLPRYTQALQRMGVECAYIPFDWSVDDHLQRRAAEYDFILVFRPDTVHRHIGALRTLASHAPLAYNNMDLHYLRMERQASISNSPSLIAEAAAMKQRECAVMEAVDCTLTPSTDECEIIKTVTPGAHPMVVPFLSRIVGAKASFAERREILFVGGYRHQPNVDAVRWFATEIFPKVRAQLGNGVIFRIVGAHPPPEFEALEGNGVVLTGFVEQLGPYFEKARVFVAPLRYGAGVKGKVAEAISHGVPSVLTPIAAEGMGLRSGFEALEAGSAHEFAAKVVELYSDEALWMRLQAAGFDFGHRVFSIEGRGVEVMREAIDLAGRVHASRNLRSH